MSTKALHDLANRWDAPDKRFAVLDASVRAVLQQCARELRAALAEQREASTEPPGAQGAIISALATLARGSHDVDGLDDAQRDIWRELAVEARREYDGLRARVAELEQRAEKAEANYRFMVERAADAKLEGYRELGQRAAAAEQRAERAEAEVAEWRAKFSSPALVERRLEEDRARIAELERDYRKELYWQAVEAEHRAERAEARVAELERELDAAQEHIHAGDECITSLHDDLARVADLVRAAEAYRDSDTKHGAGKLGELAAEASALPPREGGAS